MLSRRTIAAAAAATTLAGLACNLPFFAATTPPAVATLGELYTAAAQTLTAAASPPPTATPTVGLSTVGWPTSTITSHPLALCDAASFVEDVTVPDGTGLDPDMDFTKTWRLRNVGTCAWNSGYSLVFVSGDRMRGPASMSLPANVGSGQAVDLSVRLWAPQSSGEHIGYWKLRNPAGALFGIGDAAQGAFWVRIRVLGAAYTAYDFARAYCDASWENGRRDLPCPGGEGDSKGYVRELEDARLENGIRQDEAGLLTVPRAVNDGLISGQYPPIRIREGDRFQALVNCAYRASGCNVIFSLAYQVGGGSVKTLGRWIEAYEGKYYPVDVDLSELAGRNVKFILSVSANGGFNQDEAVWIWPRITRQGSPPPADTLTATSTSPPTFTPSSTPTETATPAP